jgi:hypothetical protein
MLINRETGLPATELEWKQVMDRTREIFASPYSSPEQLEWAIAVNPEGYMDAPVIYRRYA